MLLESLAPHQHFYSSAKDSHTRCLSISMGLRNEKGKTKWEHEQLIVLREMQVTDVEQQELYRVQQELNRAQQELNWAQRVYFQMAIDNAVRARELEAALKRRENAETAAFNQAFLGMLRQLEQALRG
ncbi:zinc finger and SCAN domain-containing protein 29-like [Scomber scombrus]|uniref:Zinc finger and SCAN domain-containing protein 29-like n=1 Tax=Scomber scombrus TaxID=13677 RepID=A0AAV1NN75_SCOSC